MKQEDNKIFLLCKKLVNRGKLSEDGVRELSEYINELTSSSEEAATKWPVNLLIVQLQKVWSDEIVNALELGELDKLLATIVMWQAVKAGDLGSVKKAIQRGADLNSIDDETGRNPLHLAADFHDIETVKLLISNGANLNSKDNEHGWTPMHFAVSMGHNDRGTVHILLSNGADVNAKNDYGDTPLDWVGTEELDDLLRRYGGKSGRLSEEDNALIDSIWSGDKEGVKNQLANGANINVRVDNSGRTPLQFSTYHCRKDITKLLRRHGGKTKNELEIDKALIESTWNENIEVIKQHLTNGADVNAKEDGEEWAPLHVTARSGFIDVAKLLVANGANVNAQTKDGRNPLHIAAIFGHNKIVDFLIAEGAAKDATIASGRYHGMTPLDLAIWRKKPETADLLRKHGGKTGDELNDRQ